MTEPRPYLPGETYLVTRRCTQRQFLLLPSEIVAQVFMYCLAVAAALSGVEVHGFAVLSNHYHLLVSDTPGSARPSRALNPRLACKDKWRRIEALRRLVGFGQAYRQAFQAWAQGIRSLCFPHGTYAMRVYHGASCAPP